MELLLEILMLVTREKNYYPLLTLLMIINTFICFFLIKTILSVVDLETGKRIHDFPGIDYNYVSFDCISVAHDMKSVFVIMDKTIKIFDFKNGKRIGFIPKDDTVEKGYATLSTSEDNKYFITGPEFGLLRVWNRKTLELSFVVDCYTKKDFNVDNVSRIYYINGNDIVTFNNQKGAVSYKIFLPGSAPAQAQDNTTITTERILASIPATEYNNIITVTPKKDEIITKQDNNKNNNNMNTKKQNNKKACCIA